MSSGAKLFSILGLIVVIILLLLLCGPRPSSGLSEDKFVEVYVQLSLAKEMFAADSAKLEQEKDRVFKEAGVNREEIDKFFSRLSQDPQKWAGVWKKIVEKLEQRRQEISPP